MADVYWIKSGGTWSANPGGTGNKPATAGTSYASLSAAKTAGLPTNDGDTAKISDAHTELDQGGTSLLYGSDSVRSILITVDDATGATYVNKQTGISQIKYSVYISISGQTTIYGVTFEVTTGNNILSFDSSYNGPIRLYGGRSIVAPTGYFRMNSNNGLAYSEDHIISSANTTADTSSSLILFDKNAQRTIIRDCKLEDVSFRIDEIIEVSYADHLEFYSCDFSAAINAAGIFNRKWGVGSLGILDGCKKPASVPWFEPIKVNWFGYGNTYIYGSDGTNIGSLEGDDGALELSSETTVVRTGGAEVDSIPISWAVSTTAASNVGSDDPLPALYVEVPAGSKTLTIYFANSTGTIKKNELWFSVDYFDSASDTTKSVATTRTNILDTTAHDTDSVSTWDGAPSTKQKQSIAITTGRAGLAKVQVFFGRTSFTDLYIDPKVEVA